MIFSTSNREVEISKSNDDSYFRKSDVVGFVESYISEIITESGVDKNLHTNTVLRSIVRGLDNLSTYSPKNNDNSAETNDNDLISRKAVLECIGMTSVHSELARKLRQLPTIPQTVCDNDCEHCSWVECPLPQKPIKHFGAIECPKCGWDFEEGDKDWEQPYCCHCGQRLRWFE